MKTWQAVLVGILTGLVLTALILIIALPPQGTPIQLSVPPTTEAVFYITGAINNPGVYSLPQGSRLEYAIAIAGGLTDSADLKRINLASKISDGEKITIPSLLDPTSPPIALEATPTQIIFPIDLNTATLDELNALPGIGEAKAESIIQYREQNGDFLKIEDIMNVPGIGEGIFSKIKDLIIINK